MISSRQNQRIKDAVRLRERRERNRRRQYLIEGVREVDRAIGAGVQLIEVFVAPEMVSGPLVSQLLESIEQSKSVRIDVSREVFERLAFGDRAEGVVAVARMPPRTLDDLVLPSRPLVAVLDGIEKPGNLGAVARSADAAGVSALVVVGNGTDVYNPNAIRASLGTLFTVPTAEADATAALSWAKRLGLPIYAARPDGSIPYTEADFSQGAIVVLGSEAEGLSPTWGDAAVTPIHLPMCGVADSLNVSATAAVLFYEALRQTTCAAAQAPDR